MSWAKQISKWVPWLGGLLAATALVFVVIRLKSYSAGLELQRVNQLIICTGGLAALAAGGANLMLAGAWSRLLEYSTIRVNQRWTVRTFGITQLGKYLPGNIFHFLGRQACGMAAGLSATGLAKSLVWETVLLLLAGSLFAILVIPLLWSDVSLLLCATLLTLTVMLSVSLVNRLLGRQVALTLMLYIGFLAISGCVFAGLLLAVSSEDLSYPDLLLVSGAYVVAWLCGMITPGAPAGIGIREIVLLVLLKSVANEADVLLTIVLSRLVTVSGDLIFFLAVCLMNKQLPMPGQQN